MKGAAILITFLGIASVVQSSIVCKDWDKDVYVRNRWNCSSYYQCTNGKLVLKPCPVGLHFNRLLNVCDYPENAKCKTFKENENAIEPEKAKKPSGGIVNYLGVLADNKLIDGDDHQALKRICKVRGTGHLIPSIADCKLFYECVYDEPAERFCYPGLFYSHKIKSCDYEENVQCATSYP